MFLEFDEEIKRRIKNNDFPVDGDLPDPVKWADMLEDDEDFREEFDRNRKIKNKQPKTLRPRSLSMNLDS